ncbi:myb/SANT-like DNA-binding domain-containing protein 3 [Anabrus simplex]|uniref:myb/SANT-like DNA-binding domain-containing protein 3 n=1 Tax=Anabrus simplex TaxID=316456 RepID=UPI0034DDB03F
MSQQQKKRAQNYTYEEALQLIRTVECYKDVVENKRTDAVTSNEKTKAWEKIAADFNAQTTTGRTGEQLRQKFDSLKKETRKYCAKLRQQRLQTGGGPHTEIKANPLYDRVQGLIKLSAEGNQSVFDSDATFLCEVPVESASGDSLQLLNVELGYRHSN